MTPTMRTKVTAGNALSLWMVRVVRLCSEHQVLWWIENPHSSWLWRQRRWQRILASPQVGAVVTDHCARCASRRKRTRFLTTTFLAGVRELCPGCRSHVVLRGHQGGVVMTKRAEAYPWSLADCLARACAQDAGWTHTRRRLDVAACARCARRVGEAKTEPP